MSVQPSQSFALLTGARNRRRAELNRGSLWNASRLGEWQLGRSQCRAGVAADISLSAFTGSTHPRADARATAIGKAEPDAHAIGVTITKGTDTGFRDRWRLGRLLRVLTSAGYGVDERVRDHRVSVRQRGQAVVASCLACFVLEKGLTTRHAWHIDNVDLVPAALRVTDDHALDIESRRWA